MSRPEQKIPETPKPVPIANLVAGFDGSTDPKQAPLESVSALDNVRFMRGALRKEFGSRALGSAAPQKIRALLEHRYILSGTVRHALMRLYIGASGKLVMEKWNGTTWELVATSLEDVQDVMLSVVSTQNVIQIADGRNLLMWGETDVTADQYDDFPWPVALMAAASDRSGLLTVDPGESADGLYKLSFTAIINPYNNGKLNAVIAIYVNGVKETTFPVAYQAPVSSAVNTNIEYEVFLDGGLSSGDTIELELESLDTPEEEITEHGQFNAPGGPQDQVVKSSESRPFDDNYDFIYSLYIPSGLIATVKFYTRGMLTADPWVEVGTKIHDNSAGGTPLVINAHREVVNIPNFLPPGSFLGIDVDWPGGGFFTTAMAVQYTLKVVGLFVGNSKDGRLDNHAGLEYTTATGVIVSEITKVADAPAARFVAAFGDRVIALRDGIDAQILASSADGDVARWEGEDTTYTALVDTREDPIDDLMVYAPIGSSIAALIRKRSIMRSFETGNSELPIGAIHWIDGVGTESPFSAQQVPGGVIFLGHDRIVYYLTESGLKPCGDKIHKELLEKLTTGIDLVDSAYDGTLSEYYLAIPESGASNLTALWVLDVEAMIQDHGQVWRKRTIAADRIGSVSRLI